MAQLFKVEAAQVDTVNEHGALLRVVETEQQLDQSRLTITVTALDARHLPHPGSEIEVLQHIALHVWIAECNIAELDGLNTLRHRLGLLW